MFNKEGHAYKGIVGQPEVEPETLKAGFFSSFESIVERETAKVKAEGYTEIQETALGIEFDKLSEERFKLLSEKLDNFMMDTRLEYFDDDFSDEKSIHCSVIDFNLAKKILEKFLSDNGLADYKRIYDTEPKEDDEEED